MDSLKEALKQALERADIVIERSKTTETKKVFCGPNKTFPSNSCEETKASMKKVFKAKLNGRIKSRITRCLSQRLKSLKCKE